MPCIPRVRVFRRQGQVPGTRYRVPAIWHLGPGTRHWSRSDAEDRTPSTEDRARPSENAHTGHAWHGWARGRRLPACPGRGRLWSLPKTIERADPTFVSRRPGPLVCPDDLEPIRPHPKLFYPVPPVPSTGLPQFLHSATSQLHPRPHTGFDPGYDPVKEEGYGGSMGDSAVRAPEPGVPLWRRGMGNPPQPC
jgi:hypothetical protein